jgi:plasmid stabilization system protein ParE
MSYTIRWSPTARISYLKILEYLEKEWSLSEVASFSRRVNVVIDFLRVNPKIYPNSDLKKIRRAVVTKQVTLFFEINGEFVDVLLLWDTRQNPSELKL